MVQQYSFLFVFLFCPAMAAEPLTGFQPRAEVKQPTRLDWEFRRIRFRQGRPETARRL